MQVRISRPSKNSMQSGRAKTAAWVVEADSAALRAPESKMGWTSAGDTLSTFKPLSFASLDAAVAYATEQGWAYTVAPAHDRKITPRNFVQNFKYRAEESA